MFNKPKSAADVDLASTDWLELLSLCTHPELVQLRTALTAACAASVRLMDEDIALREQLESRTLGGRQQLAAHDRRDQLRRLIIEADCEVQELSQSHDRMITAVETAFETWVRTTRPVQWRSRHHLSSDRVVDAAELHRRMRASAQTISQWR